MKKKIHIIKNPVLEKESISIKVNSHEYNSILNEVEKFTRISSPQQNNNKFSIEIDDLTFVFSKEVD